MQSCRQDLPVSMQFCRRDLPVPMQACRRAPALNMAKKGEFHEKSMIFLAMFFSASVNLPIHAANVTVGVLAGNNKLGDLRKPLTTDTLSIGV